MKSMSTSRSLRKRWLIPLFIIVLAAAVYFISDYSSQLQQIFTSVTTGNRQADSTSGSAEAAKSASDANAANGASLADSTMLVADKNAAADTAQSATNTGAQDRAGLQSGSRQPGNAEQPEAAGKSGTSSEAVDSVSTGLTRPLTTEDVTLASDPETKIYTEMHKMINTKILADQIWGEIDITDDKVDALIGEISQAGYSDGDVLLKMLDNWQKGDFSNAVEEHNYLWEKLHGTVGKAYGLR